MQGEGVRTTQTATPGSTITVNVGPNDPSVELLDPLTGDITVLDVEPGKDTDVQLPNVPGGTILHIRVGAGATARIIEVMIVSPTP